jgi:adenylosuccinate synthase
LVFEQNKFRLTSYFTVTATCVIGLQWGDEAKGKLVDLLSTSSDIVVRYQGGANAGHTVVSGDQVYKLHHLPSGILHPKVMNIIAPGVVMSPPTLLNELSGLVNRGIDPRSNLRISERTHLVMPWHIVEDQISNRQVVSGESIGSTLRGIGPCYRDKVGRTHAIRLADILADDIQEKIAAVLDFKLKWLSNLAEPSELTCLDKSKILADVKQWADALRPLAMDTTNYLLDALDDGKRVLMEGAQGALLDIDHGTFPFVTSSNASGVGISGGSGVPAKWLQNVIGVAKAYSTRVGGGPFPTELLDATGEKIRQVGREYGTTTGRARRCGWFDAVAVRYTSRLSGINTLSLMMMDVMGHLDEIKICTAYEIDGEVVKRFPSQVDRLRKVKPIYESFPAWKQDISGVRKFEDLPKGAIDYVQRIADLVGVDVGVISIGPDRAQTIFLDDKTRIRAR